MATGGPIGKLWEWLAIIAITAIVLNALLQMIQPFLPLLLLAAVVVIGGEYFYRRSRNW